MTAAQQQVSEAQQQASEAQEQVSQLQGQVPQLQTAVSDAQQGAQQTQSSLGAQQDFTAIPGLHLTLTGQQVLHLAKRPGILAIVPNSPVKMSGSVDTTASIDGLSNSQLWPWVSGASASWGDADAANNPSTIAVIDSGVDPQASQLQDRLLGQTDLSTLPDTTPGGDGYGHGTFVASLAAGSSAGYAGSDPYAYIYSVNVMNNEGEANIADVIAGCDWVLANKDMYDITVANLSLVGTTPASVMFDPLDQAVEQLWLNGIVVVAAAGNYNTDGQASGVPYAPGNDPFIITVGATDPNGTVDDSDDFSAPWSAFGSTLDGFAKPDLGAPGRYIVAPVPANSGLATERPASVVSPGYMELSGTSFAAPIVAGAAAYLLSIHPDWTPDQVKGALMEAATPTPNAVAGSDGVGEVNIAAAAQITDPPNPNAGLDQYLTTDADGSNAFDAAAWNSAAWSSAAWSSAAWSSAAWSSAAWSSAAWASAAWSSAAWSSAAWASAAWSSAAWANNSNADNAIPQPTLNTTNTATIANELGVTLGGKPLPTHPFHSHTTTYLATPTTTTTADTTTTTPADTTTTTDTTTTADNTDTTDTTTTTADTTDTTDTTTTTADNTDTTTTSG